MSNGDDETDADDGEAIELSVEELESRLDDAADALDAAETEADLDAAEATLDEFADTLDAADLPEPGEDDEDAEDPAEALDSRLGDLRDDLESQRGPYAEDVVDIVESAEGAVTDSEWTGDGTDDAHAAVVTFLDAAADYVDHGADAGDALDSAAEALGTAAAAVGDAGFDPDEDADAIAGLLAAAETLEADLDAAEVWDDLTVREKLDAKGFYDVLTNENRKDFPAEWNAAKIHAEEGNVELVAEAFELMGSEFMEENIVDIFYRLGRDAQPAFDVMHGKAQRREQGPVAVLGKMGDERATETLHDFIDGDGDPALQRTTLRALGAIGSPESVQPVANRLAADNPDVRSAAARALGLLGDTRAVDPLADRLAGDDSDSVRASAAWALRQIGTERALEEAAQYTDDRSYIVQAEAEKAAGT